MYIQKIYRISNQNTQNNGAMDTEKLRSELRMIVGQFFRIRKINLEIFAVRATVRQYRALAHDRSVMDIMDLIGNAVAKIDKSTAFVVTDVMLESDPGLTAKILLKKASLSRSGADSKDILTIFNPNITKENKDQFLEGLGAKGLFDEVILYDKLKEHTGGTEINPMNVIDAVFDAVHEAIAGSATIRKTISGSYEIELVGGPKHFMDVADLIKDILTGMTDMDILRLKDFIANCRSAYLESISKIYKMDPVMIEKLKQKRDLREESESYKGFADTYYKKVRDVLTHA